MRGRTNNTDSHETHWKIKKKKSRKQLLRQRWFIWLNYAEGKLVLGYSDEWEFLADDRVRRAVGSKIIRMERNYLYWTEEAPLICIFRFCFYCPAFLWQLSIEHCVISGVSARLTRHHLHPAWQDSNRISETTDFPSETDTHHGADPLSMPFFIQFQFMNSMRTMTQISIFFDISCEVSYLEDGGFRELCTCININNNNLVNKKLWFLS